MRSVNEGVVEGLSEKFSRDQNLELFKKMCTIRAFEYNVGQVFEAEFLKMPVYLSVGTEALSSSLALSYGKKNPSIFAQHRAHGYYISFGGNLESLADEILHRPTGCAKGMGGSASIHSQEIKMFGHDGFMGTQVPFGVGRILAENFRQDKPKEYGLCIMGDASAEEGYVLGAMGFAAHLKLPILFVCEDNNLSVLTTKEVRRSWEITDVAKSLGIPSYELADDPWTIIKRVDQIGENLPALMNVYVSRVLRHVGSKSDGNPEWDRFDLTKQELSRIGLGEEIEIIEDRTTKKINQLWGKKLEAY